MSSTLTDRQQQILDFIYATLEKQGVAPSLREIQAHFKLASPFGVKRHVDALTAKGALRRLEGKARALLPPLPPARRGTLTDVPLFGTIPAGLPTAKDQEPERFVSVDTTSLGVRPGASLYALQVRGDSMTGASILDGDVVFLTLRAPRPRDIVAALIDGESTLKRFLLRNGQPYLGAENPRYPDLLPAQELVIQGVMIGLLRRVHP
ncbi:MAG: repressor LexA [Opitutaceae bacterium]|jgi:repressor LexA|nr:repressor LexA [Opitutaceae bacterium]